MAAPFVPQDALKKLRTVARAKGLHVWVDHQARITGKPFVLLQKDAATLDEDILRNTAQGAETVVRLGQKIGCRRPG